MSSYLYRLGHWAFPAPADRAGVLARAARRGRAVSQAVKKQRALDLPGARVGRAAALIMIAVLSGFIIGWMDRRIPSLEIEGESLLRDLETAVPAEGDQPLAPVAR
jgi:hypothetical protein